jgi:hypothetical protein
MRVGLYSELARRSIVEARELIATQGYGTAAADIRAFRQSLLRAADDRRWDTLLRNVDFYSMSGCRDMLFNVMEHRFTIPEIAALLRENALVFEGFALAPQTLERFGSAYPTAALTDLDCWTAFEAANPDTFRNMYMFTVRRAP